MPEQKETWIQLVALTATVLAVLAAIAALRASSYSTKAQLATTQEANQWAAYQCQEHQRAQLHPQPGHPGCRPAAGDQEPQGPKVFEW